MAMYTRFWQIISEVRWWMIGAKIGLTAIITKTLMTDYFYWWLIILINDISDL